MDTDPAIWRWTKVAFERDSRGLVDRQMALRFLWVGAGVCLIGAVASALEPFAISTRARIILVACQVALGLACLLASRFVHRVPLQRLVLGAAWASVAVATVTAVAIGHGAHSLDLAFYPLVICLVAVLVGTAPALTMTVGCALIVVLLALAEFYGWLPGAASLAGSPLTHPLTTHGLLLLAGFTVGAIMLRLSNASYRSAHERESRFRELLAIAAEQYWELDAQLRLTRADDAATLKPGGALAGQLMRPLPDVLLELALDPEQAERGLAALRASQPFAAVRLCLPAEGDARARYLELSGHPKTDAQGGFAGYTGVLRDVSEQVRAAKEYAAQRRKSESELAAARDAAEAASRAKSQFLANTSHEIRTPLNGLLGLARLALRDDIAQAQRKVYLTHILESAQGLSTIMSDILDLSKIEAGKIDLELAPFDLRAELASVRHGNLPLAEAKGLTIEVVVDAAVPPAVVGDATRVRQIVGNFVSNAIKFTERGHVGIEAAPVDPARVRLAVRDTGMGIVPELRQRLFEPFSQADPSTTRRHGGTGLGLSICRELALRMGGEIGVDSTPGEGSRFWVELPLPAAPAVVLAAAGGDAAANSLAGARVLVAEDNAVNMMITVAFLEMWGVAVSQASDGAAARDAVLAAERAGRPFDAVLMDVQMPVLGGREAARELKAQLGARVPPVIALTAAVLVSERDEALRAGMCDFLTKPVDPARMRQTLVRWVGPTGHRVDS